MAAWRKLKNLLIGKIDSAYREAYLRKDINQAIAVIIAVAIMVAAYAYADYLNLQKIVWGYTAIRITFLRLPFGWFPCYGKHMTSILPITRFSFGGSPLLL